MTAAAPPPTSLRVNDFAVKLANVNGTGSSSANNLLMRAIFRMGVPVSGKNLFPSNIQGLPTWYEIRVNQDGYVARPREFDVVVAMNAQTHAKDVAEVRPGGYVVYDSTVPLDPDLVRPGVHYVGVPLAQLVNDAFAGPRERILMKNIACAGVLVAILGIDLGIVTDLLAERYAAKRNLRESNLRALHLGFDHASRHVSCPLPCHVEAMQREYDCVLLDGNTAAALGCLYAGATVAAWYPITPSTSLMDAFTRLCARYRHDEATGRSNVAVIQAEDELAAIGMVIGASWAGARAFTSTSGPGISLMTELLGLAYYAEIPAVVIDVQRAGPSTGMPTRTQQADILSCAYASHGDTRHILLFPADPSECFEMAVQAFDLAEHFQAPVIMLSDLDVGMNDWVTPALQWDDGYRPDRGRVLGEAELSALPSFQRYDDADADGVAARTLPGVSPLGAYFTRGSGHTAGAEYTESAEEYQAVVDRLARKHRAAAERVPAPVIETMAPAARRAGLVCVGSCDLAVREALHLLAEQGISADYMRIRGFPFGDAVQEFLDAHEVVFVVEQNRDAQLRSLLVLETPVSKDRLRSVLAYGGLPLCAQDVVDAVTAQLE